MLHLNYLFQLFAIAFPPYTAKIGVIILNTHLKETYESKKAIKKFYYLSSIFQGF